jgi:meso-butanediol dehydrogenase/(S,S)-butanediol dehydrogenase/diacetyl reductase
VTSDPSKVAFVTGASRGIGRALAIGLAKFGCDVAITDLPSEARPLTETAREIEKTGHKAYSRLMDVSNKPEVDAAVDGVLREVGRIEVLVNNAGILRPGMLTDLDEESWDDHFNVNAKSFS